jgi:hypothetical protein
LPARPTPTYHSFICRLASLDVLVDGHCIVYSHLCDTVDYERVDYLAITTVCIEVITHTNHSQSTRYRCCMHRFVHTKHIQYISFLTLRIPYYPVYTCCSSHTTGIMHICGANIYSMFGGCHVKSFQRKLRIQKQRQAKAIRKTRSDDGIIV